MSTPSSLRSTAASLRAHAADFPSALDAVRAVLAADVWHGPAADLLAAETVLGDKALHAAAGAVTAAANALEQRAAYLEELAQVERVTR
jgi:hypothetical protein